MEKYQSKDSGHWVGTPQILGGSSSLNAGTCHRGQASLYQALGFDNEMVKDALQHLEDRLCMPGYINSDYSKSFQNAWSNLGLEDYNNNLQSGNRSIRLAKTIMPHPDSTSNNQLSGRRRASFLFEGRGEEGPTIMNQGNLTVYPLTTAKRVLFDKSKTAVGVEVHSPSGDFSLYVRQGGKVFLASGAYETPKLLMLSGIGPRETLSQFDIPIIHANEMVGKNLMDRKSFGVGIPTLQNIKGDDIDMRDASAFFDDAWVSTTHKYAIDWGNALQGCAYMCPPDGRTQECATKITSALMLYGGMKASSEPPHLAVNEIFQRRPRVRGHVTLESASYKDHPAVYDGWNSTFEHLSSDALNDLNSIVNGVQNLVVDAIRDGGLLNNLGHSLSSDNLEGSFTDELIDILAYYMMSSVTMTADLTISCKSDTSSNLCTTWEKCVPTVPQLPNDLDDLSKVVFEGLTSSYDASGTCKVGDVVDYRTLRVQGVHGLYISDLSVLTEPVDVDPMVTAMSIGILMGNVTKGIPNESYEILPVIFSIFCIAIVFIFFSIWVFSFFISRRRATKNYTPASNGKIVPEKQEEFELLTEDNRNTLLVWKDVSCSYIKGRNKTNPPVKTLRGSSGALKEGEITAVMGPSGSCKSTLLDILAGRKSVGDVSGKFSILGHDLDAVSDGLSGLSHSIKGCSAYIPQQEFFYPTQTLEEAVAFIINMKFGKGDPHERKSLIHEYLTKVGLEAKSYASRTIGGDLGGGIVIRGLSGGERKRLALACTLALKPRILFIDELTRYVTCAKFPYLSCSKCPGNIQIISFPSQSQITRAAV
jgi:choline dehydrogenase-like flavoprotein/ABC-type lipoprotein export system ATPase subunit